MPQITRNFNYSITSNGFTHSDASVPLTSKTLLACIVKILFSEVGFTCYTLMCYKIYYSVPKLCQNNEQDWLSVGEAEMQEHCTCTCIYLLSFAWCLKSLFHNLIFGWSAQKPENLFSWGKLLSLTPYSNVLTRDVSGAWYTTHTMPMVEVKHLLHHQY